MKYTLHDLEVVTIGNPETFNCSHVVGQGFIVEGENFRFLPGTGHFSHYALATLIPYLAAKQRSSDTTDWMTYETDIACPDPLCSARFRIKQIRKKVYRYQSNDKDKV